jgi:hypothetical protein
MDPCRSRKYSKRLSRSSPYDFSVNGDAFRSTLSM